MNINLTLTDVSEEEIYALANFLKRIGTAEYRQKMLSLIRKHSKLQQLFVN